MTEFGDDKKWARDPEALLRENMTEGDYERATTHYPYSLPTRAVAFVGDVARLRAAVNESGSHFFEPQAMRFFRSKIAPGRVIGGRFFITSEQFVDGEGNAHPREYYVRWVYRAPETEMLQSDRFETRFSSLAWARAFANHAHSVLPFPGADEPVKSVNPDSIGAGYPEEQTTEGE